MPPQAARSERSERPDAATAAKSGGLRRQNAGFVKPSRQSPQRWSGRSGAERRRRRRNCAAVNRQSGCWSGANRPPAKPAAGCWRGGGIRRRLPRKAAGECDKTSILLRKPQPLEIKSEKLAKMPLHTGDYDNPRMRSVFRNFEEHGTVAHRATSTDKKNTEQGFRKRKPVPRFPLKFGDDVLIE